MDGAGLWPWWLWALSALWIGTSLVWKPADLREHAAWTTLAVIFAGLLVFVAQMTPEAGNAGTSPVTHWLMLSILLTTTIAGISQRTWPWQRWVCVAALVCGGVLLVLLNAPEAAAACGFVGVLVARHNGTAGAETDAAGTVPHPWFVATAAVVLLVLMIAVFRQALLVESALNSTLRHQRTFPSREFLARHRSPPEGLSPLSWPLWGLTIITGIAAFTGSGSSRREDAAV